MTLSHCFFELNGKFIVIARQFHYSFCMRKQQLEILVESLLPKLHGLSCVLLDNSSRATQLLIDSYTVFMIENKDFLVEEGVHFDDQEDRLAMKRYLFNTIARYMISLSTKKSRYLREESEQVHPYPEYLNFSFLKTNQKAILYLKEIQSLSVDDLEEILELERYRVLESYHNSIFALNEDSVSSISLNNNDIEENLAFQVKGFVHQTLPKNRMAAVKKLIEHNENAFKYYQNEVRMREFTQSLIPDPKLESESKKIIREAIEVIDSNIFPKERFEFFRKFTKFMTTPVVEI